ncbi:MAG: MoaD/ThiS family protein [Myxococcota bacterium]
MTVFIPWPLRSYVAGKSQLEVEVSEAPDLANLLLTLDRRHPGMRFRMVNEQNQLREHIRLFVGQELSLSLETSLEGVKEVHIICALSGG